MVLQVLQAHLIILAVNHILKLHDVVGFLHLSFRMWTHRLVFSYEWLIHDRPIEAHLMLGNNSGSHFFILIKVKSSRVKILVIGEVDHVTWRIFTYFSLFKLRQVLRRLRGDNLLSDDLFLFRI